MGWTLAKGQPVETDPCPRLSCSSVGHYVPEALQCGWQDPSGSGTVAWSWTTASSPGATAYSHGSDKG